MEPSCFTLEEDKSPTQGISRIACIVLREALESLNEIEEVIACKPRFGPKSHGKSIHPSFI